MRTMKWAGALIGRLGLGLLVLGAVSEPVRVGGAAPTAQTAQEWRYQIDEATLTQELSSWANDQLLLHTPLGTARVEDLTVELRDDQLRMRGAAQAGWFRAPVDLAASANVQGEQVRVSVDQAHINGLDVPAEIRRQLEQQLQNQLDQSLNANHVSVRSVHVAQGMLVVSGTR